MIKKDEQGELINASYTIKKEYTIILPSYSICKKVVRFQTYLFLESDPDH